MAKQQPAKENAPANAEAPKPKRERHALSTEKRLAIQLAAVLGVIQRVVSTKEGKAQFQAGDAAIFNDAAALADEINQKTIKPVEDRLKALEDEIQAAAQVGALTAEGGAQKLADLTKEMARLQTKKKNLLAQASGS